MIKSDHPIKFYYLKSFPFGDLCFHRLCQDFADWSWHVVSPDTVKLENAIVLADSNAPLYYDNLSIQDSQLLVINPIWEKVTESPNWYQVPLLQKSFLKRMRRFKSKPLVDSFLFPQNESDYKSQMLERLQNLDVWKDLLKGKQTSRWTLVNTNIHLITNTTDVMRDAESQNQQKNCEKIWTIEDLPHSLLGFTSGQRSEMKQVLRELTQDEGRAAKK